MSTPVDTGFVRIYTSIMEKHRHAAAIERITRRALEDHFRIGRAAVHRWTVDGIPKNLMASVRLLAMIRGVDVPELMEASDEKA